MAISEHSAGFIKGVILALLIAFFASTIFVVSTRTAGNNTNDAYLHGQEVELEGTDVRGTILDDWVWCDDRWYIVLLKTDSLVDPIIEVKHVNLIEIKKSPTSQPEKR